MKILKLFKNFHLSYRKKGSFEAEVGHHDDLVITLVLFAWASTQNYFKDMTDLNIRDQLYKEKIEQMEEDFMPFGFIDTGPTITEVDSDGTVWKILMMMTTSLCNQHFAK